MLVAVLLLTHIAYTGIRFAVTLHALFLRATPLQLGLLLSAFTVGPMLFSVRIGRLSDRLGCAPVAGSGLTMMLAGAVAAAAVPALPTLYLSGTLVGTGFMAVFAAINNAIAKLTRAEHMTRAFSLVAMAASVAGFIAPLIAGAALQALGHSAPYLLFCLFLMAAALTLKTCLRKYPLTGMPSAPRTAFGSLDLLKDARLRAVFLAGALFSMGWDLFVFFAPLQGIRAGLSPTAAAAILSALAAGMFSVRLAAPHLTIRFGEWSVMAAAMCFCAVAFFVYPLLTDFSAFLLAACMVGMGLGCAQPVAMTLLYRAAPRDRVGEAAGVRGTISSVSQTVFPTLLGGLGSAVGMLAVFWCGAALLAVGAWCAHRRRGSNGSDR
ncbi:MFS transporter [Variovorax sp. RCC_210]|uniref:MFS transporter n=1 Tax=Variovorax sp. RCC_210 TaxID=3239217 RepID=UPI0035236571